MPGLRRNESVCVGRDDERHRAPFSGSRFRHRRADPRSESSGAPGGHHHHVDRPFVENLADCLVGIARLFEYFRHPELQRFKQNALRGFGFEIAPVFQQTVHARNSGPLFGDAFPLAHLEQREVAAIVQRQSECVGVGVHALWREVRNTENGFDERFRNIAGCGRCSDHWLYVHVVYRMAHCRRCGLVREGLTSG